MRLFRLSGLKRVLALRSSIVIATLFINGCVSREPPPKVECEHKTVINRRGDIMCLPLMLCFLFLGGCGIFDPRGGVADYTAVPYQLPDGQVICCKVRVKNTKDIGSVVIHFERGGDGSINLIVGEENVNATNPSQVTAQQTNDLIARLLELLIDRGPLP